MAENAQTVEKAIAFALAQVGKPYKWGGVGPSSFDCSGLLWRAYQAGGVDISRSTGTQKYRGTSVSGTWLPGDLLFSRSLASPSGNHVVMYLGGGRVVEAPRTGLNVRVREAPAKGDVSARRYVKSNQSAWGAEYQKAGVVPNPFGKAKDDLGGVAGGIGDALTGPWGFGFLPKVWENGDEIVDSTAAVIDAAAFIINPHNWYRVGMFLLGAIALYVALKAASNSPKGIPA